MTRDRALIFGEDPWPLGNVLTVERDGEVGYLRRVDGRVDPAVYTDAGPTTLRRYASLEQLYGAGWRTT